MQCRGFQPTRPLRGATNYIPAEMIGNQNFNPRAPCGARPLSVARMDGHPVYFNPRAPCGARPTGRAKARTISTFQPTRPLRGATDAALRTVSLLAISTHAPLAGRDQMSQVQFQQLQISTHAPLAGRDQLPPRRPTRDRDFNPRAPCGARPRRAWPDQLHVVDISTHAPLAGRDVLSSSFKAWRGISTHAPLAGRDRSS